jgi:mxaJ protein
MAQRTALLVACLVAALAAPDGRLSAAPALRVCADPNNLPFSNRAGEGFENRLASLIAAEIGARVEYTWWPQRRGFIRNTLQARACDVVMGLPDASGMVLTTRPYYRSTYVFVAPRALHPPVSSLDDRRLASMRVGVQLIGDDFASTPPAHALAARGLTRNIVGFSVLGDYSEPNPPARIVDAVAAGRIDAALVWGPLAGFFARSSATPLRITAIGGEPDSRWPLTFAISMGVRKEDHERHRLLDEFIARHRQAIAALLRDFGVPQLDVPAGSREPVVMR